MQQRAGEWPVNVAAPLANHMLVMQAPGVFTALIAEIFTLETALYTL